MHRFFLALLLVAFGSMAACQPALAAGRRVVVELFTSQSCSSCPPADALLANLAATRQDILPLDFHVDYWDYLSWKDRFSLPEATARQRAYAAHLGAGVFTPQMVIDGQAQAVGSDRAAIIAAITQAAPAAEDTPRLTLANQDGQVAVHVGAGSGSAQLLLIGYDSMHVTQVGSGENGGRTLMEVNVVRSIRALAPWNGAAAAVTLPHPRGDHVAVLLQAADGRFLAAESL